MPVLETKPARLSDEAAAEQESLLRKVVEKMEPVTAPALKEKKEPIRCVAGFLFDFRDRPQFVVLIEKNKPDWMSGYLNGVGGKIEEGETPVQAMRREFREETGVDLEEEHWEQFALLTEEDYEVHFFRAFSVDGVAHSKTVTSEKVCRMLIERLPELKIVPNLAWLIPMALQKPNLKGAWLPRYVVVVEHA